MGTARMINPETDAFVVATRVLGFADQIGNSAIPEEIHASSKAALADLESCKASSITWSARCLAAALISMVEAKGEAITHIAHDVHEIAERLRQRLAIEKQRREGREAA